MKTDAHSLDEILACPGSNAPMGRGSGYSCLVCGRRFDATEDRRMPLHTRTGTPPFSLTVGNNGHHDVLDAVGCVIARLYLDQDEYIRACEELRVLNGRPSSPKAGDRVRMLRSDDLVYDYEVQGLGEALGPDKGIFVWLRGLGHGDNVVRLDYFHRKFRFLT